MLNKINSIYNKLRVVLERAKNRSSNLILNNKKKSALVFASISIFSYAPFSIWVLMFVSFIGLVFILNNTKKSKSKNTIFMLFVYMFNLVNLHWVGNSFLYNAPEPWLVYFMPLAVMLMAALLTLPYVFIYVLFNKANKKLLKRFKSYKCYLNIVTVPLVFIIVEILRSLSVFGLPWNLVGYSIANNDVLIQAAWPLGIFVCSYLIILISALLAKGCKCANIAALVLVVIWVSFGYARLYTKDVKVLENTKTIQIDTTKHHGFDRIKMKKQAQKYIKLVKGEKKSKNKVIVLPEMAMPYPINTNPSLQRVLQKSLNKSQTLIVGAPAYDDYDVYNTMYFMSKTQVVRYDKKMLVPFGEFMPFRNLLSFVKNFTNNFKDFSVGKSANRVTFNGSTYISMICYEAIFPFFIKSKIESKDDILLNITNDAWFYGTVAPAQHALIAKTRAVENNLNMIRTANAGISFIK